MSKKSGSGNRSSSGSPMSGLDEMQESRLRARQLAAASPVEFSDFYDYDDDVGIFAPELRISASPIDSPRPEHRSRQGSPHTGTPQGASQQVSPGRLAPTQNTGRQRTQSPRVGPSTRPVDSPGAQAIGYNPSSPSEYNQYAPYPGFRASEQPGTPDFTLMSPQQDPWVGSSTQGAARGGTSQHREATPPRTMAPPGPSISGFSTGPARTLAGQGDGNPCPAGIHPSQWTEKDKNWDWYNSDTTQNYNQQISIIARERKVPQKRITSLPQAERLAAIENLRTRGIIPAKKRERNGQAKDKIFDWANSTSDERRTQTTSVVTRDMKVTQAQWRKMSKKQKDDAIDSARTRGLLEPLPEKEDKKKRGKGTGSSQAHSPSMFENLPNRSRSGTGTPNTPNTAQQGPGLGTSASVGASFHHHFIPGRVSPEVAQPPAKRKKETAEEKAQKVKDKKVWTNDSATAVARDMDMSSRAVRAMDPQTRRDHVQRVRDAGLVHEFQAEKAAKAAAQDDKGKGKAKAAAIPQQATGVSPAPAASSSRASRSFFGMGARRAERDRSRSSTDTDDSLYRDASPARSGNAIPGITRPGDGRRSASPMDLNTRPELRGRSRLPPPAPVQSSRARTPASRTGSRPPSSGQSRPGTSLSQRIGARGSSPGISNVPDKKAQKANDKAIKESAAAAKREREAASRKRLWEEKEAKKANKRATPLKSLAPKPKSPPQPPPKPPGPSVGGRRR